VSAFNTGTTGHLDGAAKATPFTFTIPAGVAVGDLMIATIDSFLWTPSVTSYTAPTSGSGGANTWTQIGTIQDTGPSGGLNVQSLYFYRFATATDPGSTFTIQFTGTQGTDQIFWAAALDAYTGFTGIGNFAFTGPAPTATLPACPSIVTSASGSWGLQSVVGAVSGSGTFSGTQFATNRHTFNVGNGLIVGVSDTNASAGALGSPIGGGTFTATGQGWYVTATIELTTAPAATPAPPGQQQAARVMARRRTQPILAVPAGGTSANVTGVAAQVAVSGGVGTPSGSAGVTGVGAQVNVAGGTGSPSAGGSVSVTGVGAQVSAAAGAGSPSGSVSVVPGAVTAAAPAGGAASSSGQVASVIVVAQMGTVSGGQRTTPVDVKVSMSFRAYTSVTVQATMEFEAGLPVQEDVSTLASDSWISMYPG
jgi:hypothetical protein